MTVLVKEEHSSVITHHDMLKKLKTFAQNRTWSIPIYQPDKVWVDTGGGVYGWAAGSETFLAIQSSGYGSQTLHFRFRSQAVGSDANHEFIDIGCNKSGETSISTADPTHPVFQDNLKGGSFRSISFKPTSIPQVWFFGNDRQILVFAKLSTSFVQILACGTAELFDSAETEGNYCGHSVDSTVTDEAKWYNAPTYPSKHLIPWDQQEDQILYDGVLKDSTGYRCNILFDETNANAGNFSNIGRALKANNFSGNRFLAKPLAYVQRDIDSTYFPIGEYPIFRVVHPGLDIGQQLDFGAEEYIVFPGLMLNSRDIGVAVRIL
ncbi:hypothetical protein KAR91_27665 [Candidatus Pacearchaeota archaeon]|nr:hypothetical protein [Candidatus Pacearchaeota archaeon]